MRKFIFIFLLTCSFLWLISCSILGDDSNQHEHISFQTDQTEYIANLERSSPWPVYSFTLIARFKNITNQSIYLNRCYPDSPQPKFSVELFGEDSTERYPLMMVFGHALDIIIPSQ